MTAKQRRRAEKKQRTQHSKTTHVRPDWEYTLLLLLRCDNCGLEQTRHWFPHCVVCGHGYSSFVRFLEPDPRDVPRQEHPNGPLILTSRWS